MDEIRTNLDVTAAIKQNIVTLNIAVNDVLVVEVFQAFASLFQC